VDDLGLNNWHVVPLISETLYLGLNNWHIVPLISETYLGLNNWHVVPLISETLYLGLNYWHVVLLISETLYLGLKNWHVVPPISETLYLGLNNWHVVPQISDTLFHEGRRAFELHELLFRLQMKVTGYFHVPIALTERENAPRPFLSMRMMVSQERPEPVAKRIATPAWNRVPAIRSEPVNVLTELPSTFLRNFDVKVCNGFSRITVCAVILHTVRNQFHFVRRADFLDTNNSHKLFKNIMHVECSRNIYFHVVCVCKRV
jgi:hypothetical protein